MDFYQGPCKSPATRRLEARLRRWHLVDQNGDLNLFGVFAFMWGSMAIGAVLIFFVLPYLGYVPMLALPALFAFAVVGAIIGFAKRWWRNR